MKLIIILLILVLVCYLCETKNENFADLYYQSAPRFPYNEIDSYNKIYRTGLYNPNMANAYANEVAYDLSNPFPNPVINTQLPDPSSYSLRDTSDGEIEGIISAN